MNRKKWTEENEKFREEKMNKENRTKVEQVEDYIKHMNNEILDLQAKIDVNKIAMKISLENNRDVYMCLNWKGAKITRHNVDKILKDANEILDSSKRHKEIGKALFGVWIDEEE